MDSSEILQGQTDWDGLVEEDSSRKSFSDHFQSSNFVKQDTRAGKRVSIKSRIVFGFFKNTQSSFRH
jgi:hypothetical protein